MMEVELPAGGKAWSVAIRLPRNHERGAFQVFNAHFFHVYQTNDEGWFNKIKIIDKRKLTFHSFIIINKVGRARVAQVCSLRAFPAEL